MDKGEAVRVKGDSRETNVTWHQAKVSKHDRWQKNSHRSALVWITGLSASGKSSIAIELERRLHEEDINTFCLDGDNVRHGLNKDLGFSHTDRRENLRRVGEMAKLLVEAGVLTIAAFISPYEADRRNIRSLFDDGEYIEVFLDCDISVCESRDPKGLYKRARKGEIPHFTGISDPYEVPESPELTLRTSTMKVSESVDAIFEYLNERGYIGERALARAGGAGE